jgi:predicted Ser/Thr protein kinase
MIGTTVGKYRIIDRLGRGGMGIVYRGLDETLHREVAIKVLNPDITDTELLKRFRSEAISLARLNHPGIATIYELHQHGDDMLMVMEFVRGETLQALSERVGPLEPPQVAHICIQILNALSHAHRAGIVHRDLKPANVMVTDGGMVKIMDFGIARMLGGEQLTHAGSMMGTPAYMAPEQVLGHEVDGRADLYAVGVLFYRLLSRELPFKADTAIAMAQKQVADAPTPIATFRPNLPAWCESTIVKALAKSPADRYQTAEAFRSAILAAVTPGSLDELPTMATAIPAVAGDSDMTVAVQPGAPDAPTMTRAMPGTGISRPAVMPAPPPAPTPASGPIPPTERTGTTVVLGRGQLAGLAAVLIVLLGGLAALGYAAFRRSDPAPATVATTPADTPAPVDPSASNPQPPPAVPADVPAVDPAVSVPPVVPPTTAAPTPAKDPGLASGTAGRGTGRPGRGGAKPAAADTAAAPAPPVAEVAPATPEPAPVAPAPPAVSPITFEGIKVLIPQGNNMRESDASLTLTGDGAIEVLAGGKRLASVPFSSISGAFYSRSKEPRWKGADGKEQSVNVDLGRMSFFRGERNWLILVGGPEPVFVRFEDGQMQSAFSTFQQRTGIRIQR